MNERSVTGSSPVTTLNFDINARRRRAARPYARCAWRDRCRACRSGSRSRAGGRRGSCCVLAPAFVLLPFGCGGWRERFRVLVGDDDVALLECRAIVGVLQRVGPALAGVAARAGGGELTAIDEGVRQRRIRLTADRHRLIDVLAGIAIGVERGFAAGAEPLTGVLVVGETARHRRVRNREIIAVAGAHADGVERAGRRAVAARIEDLAAATARRENRRARPTPRRRDIAARNRPAPVAR